MQDIVSSSELQLSSCSQGLMLPWRSQNRQCKLTNLFFSGKQRLFPAGNFQELWKPGRAPPAPKLGGRLARCQWPAGTIHLAVAKRQHMPTWVEREPAETTGLQDGMAHTRNTNSWHPFSELPTGSLAWWELVLIGETFLWAAATLPILPSHVS